MIIALFVDFAAGELLLGTEDALGNECGAFASIVSVDAKRVDFRDGTRFADATFADCRDFACEEVTAGVGTLLDTDVGLVDCFDTTAGADDT